MADVAGVANNVVAQINDVGTALSSSQVLVTLLLCGLMGLFGQGIRAAIGLKNAAALKSGMPDQQSEFNTAYFSVSMMIGFIAGILAGLAIGIDQLAIIGASNTKVLLGIAASGYAGTDFIENAFSKIIPDLGTGQAPASGVTQDVATNKASVQPPPPEGKPATDTAPTPAKTSGPGAESASPPRSPALTAALNMVAPHVRTDVWAPSLVAAFAKFDLLTNKRMAAAIGQFLVEAGDGFEELAENLNYVHASRIVAVFPNEFPTEADATPFVGNPQALANVVYANKLGNGDQASGDGFRFRGRGLIQLTGRDEYSEFAAAMDMTAEQASAYCETPVGAAMSGCWYLASRGCLLLADQWALSTITRKVNGNAMEGNDRRIAYANAMLHALGG